MFKKLHIKNSIKIKNYKLKIPERVREGINILTEKQRAFWKGSLLAVVGVGVIVGATHATPVMLNSFQHPLRVQSGTLKQAAEGEPRFQRVQGDNKNEKVLAATSLPSNVIFKVNVPTSLTDTLTVNGTASLSGGLNTNNQDLNLGTGKLTASNIIYGLNAGTGVSLASQGVALELKTPTITNTDLGSSQYIFKTIKAGSDKITAGSNTDTLELAAGTGITFSTSTTDKKITINSTDPGFTDGGSTVYLTTTGDSLGIGTTTASSFKLQIAGNTGPNADITYDLGSSTLRWNKLYVGEVVGASSTGTQGYIQRTSGSIAPTNITDSFNLGSTATSSATVHLAGTSDENSFINTGNLGIGKVTPLFKLDVAGSGSISASLTLGPLVSSDAGTCNSSAAGRLYYDGPTAQYYYCDGAIWQGIGSTSGGTNWFTQSAGAIYPINTTLDLFLGAQASTSAKIGFLNVNSNTPTASISASSGGGALKLTSSGIQTSLNQTLTIGGSSTGNILVGPLNGTTASYVAPLDTNTVDLGTPSLNFRNLYLNGNLIAGPSGTIAFWQIQSGGLFPTQLTTDLMIGGTSSSAAKFAILNMNSGTPTASISAQNVSAQALVLSSDGSIQSVRNNTLTIGGATTGNITLSPSNGSGITTNTGTMNLSTGNTYQIAGTNVLSGTTLGTGITGSSLTSVGTIATGVWNATTLGTAYGGTGQDFSGTAQGNILYFSAAGTLSALGVGTNGQVLQSGGAAANPSWTTVSGSNWDVLSGAISPQRASTVDFLLGGSSTSSAEFGVININSGTVTATSSGSYTVRGALTAHTFDILDNGTLNFRRSPGGDGGVATVLYLGSNGNVGVGNASPTSLFSVGSSDRFQVNSSGQLTFAPSSTTPIANISNSLTPISAGTTGSYATLTNLPTVLRWHSSVVYNGYLFVTGGNTGSTVATVYSAPIKSDGTIGSWATLTNLPAARDRNSSVAYNGYLFVTGGYSGSATSTVYSAPIKSDGTIGSWATLTNLPAAYYWHSSVVYNGYLFVTGGFDSGGVGVATVYSAPIKSDGTIGSWATLTNLPAARREHSSVVYNGYLFVTGGRDVNTVYSAQIKSDGTIGSWATLCTLPAISYYHSSVVYNGYLFVTGGNNVSTVYYAQIKSDGTTGSYSTLTNLPTISYYHSSVVYNGYLFVTGGYNGSATVSTIYSAPLQSTALATNTSSTLSNGNLLDLWNNSSSKFSVNYNGDISLNGGITFASSSATPQSQLTNPVSPIGAGGIGTWSTLANLPQTLYYHASTTYNGYLFITGGATVSTVYSAQIKADGTLGGWQTLTNMPAALYGHVSVAYNGYLYIVGGATVSTVYSAPIKSDGTIGAWATLSTLPQTLYAHGGAVYNGYLFVTGGYNTAAKSTVYSAKINGDGTIGSWATLSTLPAVRQNLSTVAYNGYLYVTGGSANGTTGTSTVYSAKINADGTIGSWGTLPTLSQVLFGHAAAVYNGYLFISGGYSAISTVYSAPLQSTAFALHASGALSTGALNTGQAQSWTAGNLFDLWNNNQSKFSIDYAGNLTTTGGINFSQTQGAAASAIFTSKTDQIEAGGIGTWSTLANLPATTYLHGSATYNGYVFVVGGNSGSTVSTVYSAKVSADGTLGGWNTLSTLPAVRQDAGVTAYNGYLFVAGGNSGAGNVSTMYSAKINSDGTIAAWATLSTIPVTLRKIGFTALNGYLLITGGESAGSTTAVSTMYSAKINSDGTIAAWATLSTIPAVTYSHGSVAVSVAGGNYLFVTGGYSGAAAVSTSYSARIN